jgi:hypothetical protein
MIEKNPMKRIIILAISMFISSVYLWGQQTIYVIDNVTVDNFDGSQLKGKNIKDYQITTTGKGTKAITVHAITTAPFLNALFGDFPKGERMEFSLPKDLGKGLHFSADSIELGNSFIFRNPTHKMLYIIDGERTEDVSALQKLSSARIKKIQMYKGGTTQEKFGTDLPVMVIETKDIETELNEILKKLPNVKVSEDGTITADGQPINKVTINGSTIYKDK